MKKSTFEKELEGKDIGNQYMISGGAYRKQVVLSAKEKAKKKIQEDIRKEFMWWMQRLKKNEYTHEQVKRKFNEKAKQIIKENL